MIKAFRKVFRSSIIPLSVKTGCMERTLYWEMVEVIFAKSRPAMRRKEIAVD